MTQFSIESVSKFYTLLSPKCRRNNCKLICQLDNSFSKDSYPEILSCGNLNKIAEDALNELDELKEIRDLCRKLVSYKKLHQKAMFCNGIYIQYTSDATDVSLVLVFENIGDLNKFSEFVGVA